MKIGFHKCEDKIQLATAQVAVVGSTVKKILHPMAQDYVKSNEEPVKSSEEHVKSSEEQVKSNDAEGKTDQPGAPVSIVHSPHSSKNGDKCDEKYVCRSRRLDLNKNK
ncbi:unnamed protein product [Microthlaspi erraticum]|uniref:Uncharacterized protein n=1 Tax=Microthlaspi erraticum TaxID=1685480 RepID=A0A6D2KAV1_9BRAS|nr:unnamed protein product [Microthlaspi erraticum]